MNDQKNITLFEKLGMTPSRVIRVFGMRRSGNHALINWLMRNAPGNATFLNNCAPGKCPADTARSMEINGTQLSLDEATVVEYSREISDGGILIISYEDFMPEPSDPNHAVTLGLTDDVDVVDIVLFRSFMNWSASLLKKLQGNDSHAMLDRLRIMIIAMDRYVEALELAQEAPGALRPINYDRWVSRADYRVQILRALGFDDIDNSLGAVQRYGGGSSFQKSAKAAEDLSPLDRWHAMVNDPEYQLLLLTAAQHDELRSLMRDLMKQDEALLEGYLDQARFPYQVQLADEVDT